MGTGTSYPRLRGKDQFVKTHLRDREHCFFPDSWSFYNNKRSKLCTSVNPSLSDLLYGSQDVPMSSLDADLGPETSIRDESCDIGIPV